MEAASDQRGERVVAEAEAGDHPGGDGDDVLGGAGQFDPDHVARRVEPQGGRRQLFAEEGGEGVVRRGHDHQGRQPPRQLGGEAGAGEDGEADLAAGRLALLGRHLAHPRQRLDLDPLGGRDHRRRPRGRVDGEVLAQRVAEAVRGNGDEQRLALDQLGHRRRRSNRRRDLDPRQVVLVDPIGGEAPGQLRASSPQHDVRRHRRRLHRQGGAERPGAKDSQRLQG